MGGGGALHAFMLTCHNKQSSSKEMYFAEHRQYMNIHPIELLSPVPTLVLRQLYGMLSENILIHIFSLKLSTFVFTLGYMLSTFFFSLQAQSIAHFFSLYGFGCTNMHLEIEINNRCGLVNSILYFNE